MTDRATWKGNDPSAPAMTVCTHMPSMLDELARLVTIRCKAAKVPDFYVKGIAGFGSFRSNTVSAGTDNGSHIDLDFRGLSDAQRKIGEACAREVGFYADIRLPRWYSAWFGRWLTATWWPHCHMLPFGDPHLSSEARMQLAEWVAGENGLAGHDKDDGPRTFVGRTWSAYLAIKAGVVTVAQATLAAPKVKAMQAALRLKPVDGAWGPVTERQAWLTKTTAMQGRAFFVKRPLAERKSIQARVGATQDGAWGPKTQAAVKATVKVIQAKAFGVGADGVWGPVTDAAYYALRRRAYRP